VRRTFRGGFGDSDSWWDGFFAGGSLKPTFHGLGTGKECWALEAHRDGHFLAALWELPEVPGSGGDPVLVVPDFFSYVFGDFFNLIELVLKEAELKATYCATATLVKANTLAFTVGQHLRTSAAALKVENLQWPIVTAEVGSADWQVAPKGMAEALCGAYGFQSPAGRTY